MILVLCKTIDIDYLKQGRDGVDGGGDSKWLLKKFGKVRQRLCALFFFFYPFCGNTLQRLAQRIFQ